MSPGRFRFAPAIRSAIISQCAVAASLAFFSASVLPPPHLRRGRIPATSKSPEVAALRVRGVMACDASEQLARVRVPTLYLQGEQDRLVRKSSFQEIKEVKPDTILASIAAPHFVLQREPRKAADLIAHFVANLPS